MSAPVNVLAVLDAEVATLRRLESWVNEALAPTRADADDAISAMTEARAAVAELIEAAQDYRDCLHVVAWSHLTHARRAELMQRYQPEQGTRPMRETERRFNAALARCGGQS